MSSCDCCKSTDVQSLVHRHFLLNSTNNILMWQKCDLEYCFYYPSIWNILDLYNINNVYLRIIQYLIVLATCEFRRMNARPISLDGLTIYASLGFELQLIHTFHTIGLLYGDLNDFVESGLIDDMQWIHQARQRNLVLYAFCKKFNSHYNLDLIIHLTCYQLNVLLVLFNFVKRLATSVGTEK